MLVMLGHVGRLMGFQKNPTFASRWVKSCGTSLQFCFSTGLKLGVHGGTRVLTHSRLGLLISVAEPSKGTFFQINLDQ